MLIIDCTRTQLLDYAITNNQIEAEKWLLRQPKMPETDGTIKHWVAHRGYADILELYMSWDTHLTSQDIWGSNVLFQAVQSGAFNCVKVMLEKGQPVNFQGLSLTEFVNTKNKFGRTALHAAASTGQIAMMQYLISKGADVTIKYVNGMTALDYAITNNQIEALRWLERIKKFTTCSSAHTITVTSNNDNDHANKWQVTYQVPSVEVCSFHVSESEVHDNINTDGIKITLSKNAIINEMQRFQHLPYTEQKPAAVVSLGTKSIAQFSQALSNPQQEITKFTISDKTNTEEKIYHYDPALDVATGTLQTTNKVVNKIAYAAFENSPNGIKVIAKKVTALATGALNSVVCIAKELAKGNDISATLKTCSVEKIKDIAKNGVSTAVSLTLALLLGKTCAKALGSLISEIVFNPPLNETEFRSIHSGAFLKNNYFHHHQSLHQQLHQNSRNNA